MAGLEFDPELLKEAGLTLGARGGVTYTTSFGTTAHLGKTEIERKLAALQYRKSRGEQPKKSGESAPSRMSPPKEERKRKRLRTLEEAEKEREELKREEEAKEAERERIRKKEEEKERRRKRREEKKRQRENKAREEEEKKKRQEEEKKKAREEEEEKKKREEEEKKKREEGEGKEEEKKPLGKGREINWNHVRKIILDHGLHTDIWTFSSIPESEIRSMSDTDLKTWIDAQPISVKNMIKRIENATFKAYTSDTFFQPSRRLPAVCTDARASPCSTMTVTRSGAWDALEIRADTILYHGTSIELPDHVMPRTPFYLAGSPRTAAAYAWRDTRKLPKNGKVIIFLTTRPQLLWMPTYDNLTALRNIIMDQEALNRFLKAFQLNDRKEGAGIAPVRRHSNIEEDARVVDWFCTKDLFDQFDGIGYKGMPLTWDADQKFHDEFIFCRTDGLIRLSDIEYRFTCYAPNCIFEVNYRGGIHSSQSVAAWGGVDSKRCGPIADGKTPSEIDEIKDAFHDTLDELHNQKKQIRCGWEGNFNPFEPMYGPRPREVRFSATSSRGSRSPYYLRGSVTKSGKSDAISRRPHTRSMTRLFKS